MRPLDEEKILDFDFYCNLTIERITKLEKGSCKATVQIVLNGLRLSLGVMDGKAGKPDWIAWPTRQTKGGGFYPIVWPANKNLRDAVERRVFFAVKQNQLEKFFNAPKRKSDV